eukprot:gene41080-50835_t
MAFTRHVAHGHGFVHRGAQQAAGHFANLLAVFALQFGVFAHGHTLQCDEANALALQAGGVVDLREHLVCSGETPCAGASRATHLLDGPVQRGFRRRGGGVDVVAIQAQPGFQAQRVA